MHQARSKAVFELKLGPLPAVHLGGKQLSSVRLAVESSTVTGKQRGPFFVHLQEGVGAWFAQVASFFDPRPLTAEALRAGIGAIVHLSEVAPHLK